MRKQIKIEVYHIKDFTFGYKGTIEDKKIFENSFEETTEGIVEFTGAIHGLMWIKKSGELGDVFIKNRYIKECIEKKKYPYIAKGEKANEFLKKCKFWLLEQISGINIYLYE